MKVFKFVLLLMSVGVSFTFAENDSSENENPTSMSENMTKNKKNESESKTLEKNSNILQLRRKPDVLLTPEKQLIINPRLHYAQFPDDGLAVPHLGFPSVENQRRNIYLSDNTGEYDVKLQNFQQGKPSDFQTALGAISAHILNQRNNQEYVPYPPNGDPYNYPAYRGHPRATEPPVVRAYERASNSNYGNQPTEFDQRNPRRLFSPNDYQLGFSDRFQNFGPNFYANPELFNEGAFYPQTRSNSEPVYESSWYKNQGEERTFQRPVK